MRSSNKPRFSDDDLDSRISQSLGGFWKPGTAGPGMEAVGKGVFDRESTGEQQLLKYNPLQGLSIDQQRRRLPIWNDREHILYLVENYQTVVIVGETGCGKTTQIPQFLHESGWTAGGRVVACTQPRRVAATTVAQRVAQEQGVPLGTEVGFAVRFEDCTSERTAIKYLTDGLLVRETMLDPLLSKYSVVMLDEAHERSLHTDILLGLLKKVLKKRKDLRVIVASATVDAEFFRDYFNRNTTDDRTKDTAAILSVKGRQYPVDICYLSKPSPHYIRSAIDTVMDIHKGEPYGDILLFLTGSQEIDDTCEALRNAAAELDSSRTPRGLPSYLRVLPLYSGLPADQQLKAFESSTRNTRKVVVSTNIAETSVTIPGIVYVVDSGFVKVKAYNPQTMIDSLVVVPVSQASAQQRAGRAGRERPGKVYRLYTEKDFRSLRLNSVPEMQRTNLLSVILQLKALGINDVLNFSFPSPPSTKALVRANETLFALGAINEDMELSSPLGETIAEFPVDPCLTRMLLASGEYRCSEEVLTIAAMLTVRSVFVHPPQIRRTVDAIKQKFAVFEGDHIFLLNVFNKFLENRKSKNWCKTHYINFQIMLRVIDVRNQLRRYMKRFRVPLISCIKEQSSRPSASSSSLSEPKKRKKGVVEKPDPSDPTVRIRKSILSGFFANAAYLSPDGTYSTIRGQKGLQIHPSSILFKKSSEWIIFHEILLTDKIYMRDITVIDPLWLTEVAPRFYEYTGLPNARGGKKRLR